MHQNHRGEPIAGKPRSYRSRIDHQSRSPRLRRQRHSLINLLTITAFVSCLSKDSACKPPTRVAGTSWA
ncbi:hypothetical protein C4K16_5751 [Pseudomonas chlororaphis subsp. aurantiaca]|nr:hypothetical protein C4K16_5751 [Pseudomonas chlororaphis subsp. aurantiaca]AZD82309.1 hypothetical protein C4K15_5787 [Pseudomonas chlororaphis subsp. aurantiaca]